MISYLRLFKGTTHSVYRRVVWISMVAIVAGHLGCALTLILACNPVSPLSETPPSVLPVCAVRMLMRCHVVQVNKSWNPTTPGTCLAPGPSFTAYAIVTIISDVVVAVIPIPVLLQLKVNTGKKVGLIVIFLLGLFTTLCSVFRYLQIDRIQYGDGNSTMLILWGVIEFNVGVSSEPYPAMFRTPPLSLSTMTNPRPFSQQNVVSSLPFLAPIFLRKAKEYTTKYSGGSGNAYGSGGARKIGGKLSDAYKLSSVSSQRKGTFATVKGANTGSEENILQNSPENTIVKSVTYSVRVD